MKKTGSLLFLCALALCCLFATALAPSPARAASWYNASWSYRAAITVQHGQVGGSLTDFPVYVNLADMPAGFWSAVNSDCGDIRVTESDGTTEVPREVVTCSVAGQSGELHFKAPALSSSSDSIFYIYYGDSGASDYATSATYGAQNVWDSNFKGVWHLKNGSTLSGRSAGFVSVYATSCAEPQNAHVCACRDGSSTEIALQLWQRTCRASPRQPRASSGIARIAATRSCSAMTPSVGSDAGDSVPQNGHTSLAFAGFHTASPPQDGQANFGCAACASGSSLRPAGATVAPRAPGFTI